EVAGDVDPDARIFSNDLAGRAGVIEHTLSSTDSDFAAAGVNGVAVNVRGASPDDLVIISPTGDPLTVFEEGSIASYIIAVVNPAIGDISVTPVYLTVSAGMVSTGDRQQNGESILVSLTENGDYAKSIVLTFDDATDLTRTIFVKAVDDTAEEGDRLALISHSINSLHPDFEDLAMADIFVNVIDDDKPGVSLTQINTDSIFGTIGDVDELTEVLEGGFTDQYEVVLTKQPDAGETVTVHLSTDAQISLSVSSLTFTYADWNIAQRVTVTATSDDGKDGDTLSTIRHTIATTGGTYSAFGVDDTVALLDVAVYDKESEGVIVRQSDGSTEVVGDATDSYFVRLTKAPTANVTLTPSTDGQTLVEPTAVTFTTVNWDQWVEIVVSADPSAPTSTDPIKSFETASQDLNRIQGPLIVEGGVGGAVDQSLQPALVLPNESNDAPTAGVLPTEEGADLDVLNIFHTDNSDQDVGDLFYRTEVVVKTAGEPDENVAIVNPGIALTGFEMAVDRLAGSAGAEQLFGGGITMNDFEIVEILLGKGDETLTIDKTPDGAITVVHGGGGNDAITINDRGDSPLVVYGDTSEDRVRYSNSEGGASVHGSSFNNDGNDTIDASGMQVRADGSVGIVIYGGFGDDIIDGSQADDHIAGGTGSDTIRAQGGNDHVYGDSHFNVDPQLFAQDQLGSIIDNYQQIAAMFIVTDRTIGDDLDPVNIIDEAGADTIEGGDGSDIIFGDHGTIDQLPGTRRIATTANVQSIFTTLPTIGSADVIRAGADDDIVIGGVGDDRLDGGADSDLILGDAVT
ncbi:MAG: calcium-binding protein, partial [Planctomycetota bacterium]